MGEVKLYHFINVMMCLSEIFRAIKLIEIISECSTIKYKRNCLVLLQAWRLQVTCLPSWLPVVPQSTDLMLYRSTVQYNSLQTGKKYWILYGNRKDLG